MSCQAYDCDAIDRVVLQVGQVSTAGVQASDATIALNVPTTLDVPPGDVSRPSDRSPQARPGSVRVEIGRLRFAKIPPATIAPGTASKPTSADSQDPHGAAVTYVRLYPEGVRNVAVTCTDLVVRAPQFACNQGSLSAQGGLLGPIEMSAAVAYNSSDDAVSFRGTNLKLAGGIAQFNGAVKAGNWSFEAAEEGLDLAATRKLIQPWFQLPDGDSLTGHVELRLQSTGTLLPGNLPGNLQVSLTTRSSDLNYSNQAGTTVGQNVVASLTATASRDHGRLSSDLQLHSSSGQILAGAVLLDFAKNPLSLAAHVEPNDRALMVSQIRIQQTDLVDAQGNAQIAFGQRAAPTGSERMLERAHFDVYRLYVGAAYRSFLQLTLATTDFGALNVGGSAGGSFDIDDDRISQVSAYLQNVSMADSTARLSLANANGELHWSSDPHASVKPSQLSWSSSSAYGLIGGPVQMGFTTRAAEFVLDSNTRFPIFDGALVVHTLALRGLGAPDTELEFDAHIEPISMPLLSKAFGWPVLSGQLAGRIPGVTYRDRVLAVQGDLAANVFDGTIIGSHLRLSDPWGPWPRLNADVAARHLDLDLLTHTFSIGSISGRLDADIRGLELFNWAPVAFDARLETTPGDRSRHLISQRAVTSISGVGGGGGGVGAALQSGVLQFFKQFHYDRLGIRCQLRDEVCLMSGIEPAKSGYYLVKGRGLPRIDIIGNAGRVDWTQLVGQITASMHSQNILVR